MNLPFTHPVFLWPTAGLALLCLGAGLWAQSRAGLGVRVVGQRPWALGLGLALLLGGLGIGIAEPRWGVPEAPRLTVHIVLDASRSMLAVDANGTSRWIAALQTIDRVLAKPSPGLRFSVDLLTGDAVPLMPPGEDHTLLRDALRAVKPGEIGSPGTSFGRGVPQVLKNLPEKEPAILFVLSDGEESWLAEADALQRASSALKASGVPLYAIAFGQDSPISVAGAAPDDPRQKPELLATTANPDFLRRLAEASGGRMLQVDEAPLELFQKLAEGKVALPVSHSLIPSHPEWGAWIAMAGLLLWLLAAGKPMVEWRPILLVLVVAGVSQSGQAAVPDLPLPQGVKAWLAQRALDEGDLITAQKWRPQGIRPNHRLLAAEIDLRSKQPTAALKVLAPLTGQGVPRPIPVWRVPALLMAARAQVALNEPDQAKLLLERLLLESPGRAEAVHDLQSLLPAPEPPPPPNPKSPPPPRPSQGARQDELEGFQQRIPKKPTPPAGVKDI